MSYFADMWKMDSEIELNKAKTKAYEKLGESKKLAKRIEELSNKIDKLTLTVNSLEKLLTVSGVIVSMGAIQKENDFACDKSDETHEGDNVKQN